jgi:alkylated DNA nucleotide flippase Atl1
MAKRRVENSFSVQSTTPVNDYVGAYSELAEAVGSVLTERKIGELIRNREENGLEKHCRVVGRQVLVSVSGFWQWIDEEHDGKKRPAYGGRYSKTARRR